MMVESQSKLCLVEKKNEKKEEEEEMKIKVHGRTLNIIKRLLKSCQSKIVLLVVPLEKWETLLSQARKC